jgi:hypothetical protein
MQSQFIDYGATPFSISRRQRLKSLTLRPKIAL